MDTFHLPTDRRKAVALISKPAKPELSKILPELIEWLNKHNYDVVIDRETTAYIKAPVVVPRGDLADRALDLVIVLGGDGTLLVANAPPRSSDGDSRRAASRISNIW